MGMIKKAILFSFLVILCVIFSGCNDSDSFIGQNNKDNGVVDNSEDCLSPDEVEELETDFLQTRKTLSEYLNSTEFVTSEYSATNQIGNLTADGRARRISYEELREQYLDVMYKKCKKTNGLAITNNIWLKGYDLVEYEIHPEYFLDLPIYSKSRILYDEYGYFYGETTQHLEFNYYDEIDGHAVGAKIEIDHVGTVQDQWQSLAQQEGFETASYDDGESAGYSIYYTNYYTDDYDWNYKGIFFQIYGFKVFAGYYNWGSYVGTDLEFFNNIEITEETAREMYEYLVYKPGYFDDL